MTTLTERLARESEKHDRAWSRYMTARARYMAAPSFRTSQAMIDESDALARSQSRLYNIEHAIDLAERKTAAAQGVTAIWACVLKQHAARRA